MANSASLSCHRLWKIFGPQETETLRAASADGPDIVTIITRIRRAGRVPAVCDVSFDVGQDEVFVVMGLSGSGKSTLVRCLSRLVEPTAGEIIIDGKELLKLSERDLMDLRRHKLGMVFQNFGLLPHLSVLDNVAYPLRVQGVLRKEREKRALEVIELVGLGGREAAFPRELSGGMQQRVGIARSLAVKPDMWFLDEPFSALDPLIRRQMQDEFLRLQSVLKMPVVFITHDFLEAIRVADRIAIMREGRVVQVGTGADLVLRPADAYVAEFTRDVPRDKVITAGSIAEPALGATAEGETVDVAATLDSVLPKLAGRSKPLWVAGTDGRIVGQLTTERVLAALAASGSNRGG